MRDLKSLLNLHNIHRVIKLENSSLHYKLKSHNFLPSSEISEQDYLNHYRVYLSRPLPRLCCLEVVGLSVFSALFCAFALCSVKTSSTTLKLTLRSSPSALPVPNLNVLKFNFGQFVIVV